MLDALRKGATKGPAKVLFIVLILSFGIWGIGDVVRGVGADTPAIVVGDVEVSPQAVQATFRRELDRLRQVVGPELTAERARDMGLMESTISQLARQAVIDAAAQELGIVAAPDALRRQIAEIPAFQDADGTFNRDLFRRVLSQNNLTEERFLQGLQQDLVRETLLGTAATAAAAPAPLVAPLYAWQNQERVANALFVPDAAQELPETPDQAELQQVYDENIDAFTAPEYRALTALVLRPGDLTDEVNVTDEDLQQAYEAALPTLETPETRTVSQVLAGSQETAEAVAHAAQQGATLAEAAEQAGAPAPMDLGSVTFDTLPPSAAEAVFGLEEGATSAAVQTPIGWHVFHVSEVTAGEVPPLEEVREQMRERVAAEKAVDVLYDLSADVEDALGGGATLEEAAERLDLELTTIPAVDAQGLGPEGQPVAVLPEEEVFLNTAFSLQEGEESLLEEIGRGYFIVRVDSVTPPQPRPFEEVRDQVVTLWQAQTRREMARAKAEDLAERLRGGPVTVASVAEEAGVPHGTSQPFTRTAETVPTGAAPLPADVVDALFEAEGPGAVAQGRSGQGWVVARLEEILPVEQPTQAEGFAAARTELRASLADDLANQLLSAFGDRYGVEVNREVIDRAL